uniref:Acylglycerol kinase, mitochondrial n=1 Tax=Oncorhynchus mykiss TaxID=8022 RepID=A0A8C7QXB2_ONCMY
MARVVKVFVTLRNHWKKSTVAACALSYGGHWLYGKHCDNLLRRDACLAAREFGRQQISPQEQLKKATVILNPAACRGKANNLFEKNAAPILHLAGMEVTLVKTDYEGQAKKLMELMEQTDMLIVAGGDGTLQEVITGLLRRADHESFSKTPIGFIPLGSHNSLSESLHILSDNQVKHITSATLSILQGETVPLDVLQIKGEKEQPVFALIGLRWGAFRDVASTIKKYWYLGPLKIKAAHWFSTLREWPQVHEASVSYIAPTLRPPDLPEQKPQRPNLMYRIARRLKNYWYPPIPESPKVEEPERWDERTLSTLELSIQTQNKNPLSKVYINHWTRCITVFDNYNLQTNDMYSCINWFILVCVRYSFCSMTSPYCPVPFPLPQEGAGFYNIDNEEYEAMSVEVRLLPRKLRFFCSAERREQLLTQVL